MQYNSKIKTILLAVAMVLLLLIGWTITKDWLKPNLVKFLGGYTSSEVKSRIDTLEIRYNDIYVKYKDIVTKGTDIRVVDTVFAYKYIPVYDPNKPHTTGKPNVDFIEIKHATRYHTAVNDSILDGNIETILDLDNCKIVEQTLKYTPKIPYIREKIITIVETKETILSQDSKARIGAGLDANLNKELTPKIYYLTKKNWLYNAGYTKSFDPLRPDTFNVGLAKLF